ncbi:hypothetical protein RFI_08422, partial [Reticulomyxa filosa]
MTEKELLINKENFTRMETDQTERQASFFFSFFFKKKKKKMEMKKPNKSSILPEQARALRFMQSIGKARGKCPSNQKRYLHQVHFATNKKGEKEAFAGWIDDSLDMQKKPSSSITKTNSFTLQDGMSSDEASKLSSPAIVSSDSMSSDSAEVKSDDLADILPINNAFEK